LPSIRLRVVAAALIPVTFVIAIAFQAHAQEAPPKVSVSFGIDTTLTDVGKVVGLVRAYLAKPDSSARSRGLWSTATDFDRRVGAAHKRTSDILVCAWTAPRFCKDLAYVELR